MPYSIIFMGDIFHFSISRNAKGYKVSFKSEIGEVSKLDQRLEDAPARMRLWLSKVGIIK